MADSLVMMALGDYRFGLSTAAYETLERSSAWRWEAVERIGKRPIMQFLGPGDETVSMSGTIFPHFRGGLRQLEAMRGQADKGEPLLLVDGVGRVWGRFCITEVRETQSTFFSNGVPRKIEFSLSLARYGEDTK